jgi:hypothetical protein
VDGGVSVALSAGDTLLLEAGERSFLLIRNLHGSADRPIVIINYQGAVRLNTDHYFGISFRNCSHIKLTGTGTGAGGYGIQILKVARGSGIGISDGSTDFEVEAVEIANTASSGISAKSDPDCSLQYTRGTFLMSHILIHDNYLHDIGEEGLYIGNTFWFGRELDCGGTTQTVYSHLLNHVHVYHNRFEDIGWDGIQINAATEDCIVRDNIIYRDSCKEYVNQMSGIMIGAGSAAECYNNLIIDGHGSGIEYYGPGGQKIYNNVIVNAGLSYHPQDPESRRYGIYLADRDTKEGAAFYIYHNTIINPKSDGIRFVSLKSRGNKIQNNLIVNPGAYDEYEKNHTSFRGIDAFVMLTDSGIEAEVSHNLFLRDIAEARFHDADAFDYRLEPDSPAIDRGEAVGICFDILNAIRPRDEGPDIGAYEASCTTAENPAGDGPSPSRQIGAAVQLQNCFPNPVRRDAHIRFVLEKAQTVDLVIYNVLGEVVKTLAAGQYFPAGLHQVEWSDSAASLQSGFYWCVLRAGTMMQKVPFCLIR